MQLAGVRCVYRENDVAEPHRDVVGTIGIYRERSDRIAARILDLLTVDITVTLMYHKPKLIILYAQLYHQIDVAKIEQYSKNN